MLLADHENTVEFRIEWIYLYKFYINLVDMLVIRNNAEENKYYWYIVICPLMVALVIFTHINFKNLHITSHLLFLCLMV